MRLFLKLFLFSKQFGDNPALLCFFLNRANLVHLKITNDVENKYAAWVKIIDIFATILFKVCQMKKYFLNLTLLSPYWVMIVNTFSISWLNLFGPNVYSYFLMTTDKPICYTSWGESTSPQESNPAILIHSTSGIKSSGLRESFKPNLALSIAGALIRLGWSCKYKECNRISFS